MCYAIPGRVVRIEKGIAVIDYFGEERKARLEAGEVIVGDYVYAQGGFVIQKIPDKDALPILSAWKERFAELKRIDKEITSKRAQLKVRNSFLEIIRKAREGVSLTKEEGLILLRSENPDEKKLLFETANIIRKENLENSCCIHGIIEFSSHCDNNCSYCGIRKGNEKLERYKMTPDEIIETAKRAVNDLGFKALVLQSGEDRSYSTEDLVTIIRGIREKCGVLLFMSVGSRSKECYTEMFEAGARGVLLRFETSNQEVYEKIHSGPKAIYKERLELIRHCQNLGYLIATGSIIGLPETTDEDLFNDIVLTKSLGTEMYSFGPLIPHPDTPLSATPRPDIDNVLKTLAVARLIDRNAKILVTTALETLDPKGRERGLLSGANSLMINATPKRFRESYEIYKGRPDKDKEIEKNIEETLSLLHSIGRAPTDLGM